MATKFIHKSRTEIAHETRRGFFERLEAPRAPLRGRFSFVSIGILATAIFLLAYTRGAPAFRFVGQPVLHGEGVILEKLAEPEDTKEDTRLLRVEMVTQDGRRLQGVGAASREQWERLSAGDRVGLLFQTSRDGASLRIRQVGQVALPAPIQ